MGDNMLDKDKVRISIICLILNTKLSGNQSKLNLNWLKNLKYPLNQIEISFNISIQVVNSSHINQNYRRCKDFYPCKNNIYTEVLQKVYKNKGSRELKAKKLR